MTEMLKTACWNKEKMQAALVGDFSNATDLADYLVRQGMSFRQAHEVVGKVVQYCLQKKLNLENITLSELQDLHPQFSAEVLPQIQHLQVMMARTSFGGTSPDSVKKQIQLALKLDLDVVNS